MRMSWHSQRSDAVGVPTLRLPHIFPFSCTQYRNACSSRRVVARIPLSKLDSLLFCHGHQHIFMCVCNRIRTYSERRTLNGRADTDQYRCPMLERRIWQD